MNPLHIQAKSESVTRVTLIQQTLAQAQKIVANSYFRVFVLLCAAATFFGISAVHDEIPNSFVNKDIEDLHHYAEGAFETIDKEYLKRLKPLVSEMQLASRPLFSIYLFVCALLIILAQGYLVKRETKNWITGLRSFMGKIWIYAIPALVIYLYISNIEASTAIEILSAMQQMPDNEKYINIFSAFGRLYEAVDSMESLSFWMLLLCWFNSIILIIYTLACSVKQKKQSLNKPV